MSKILNVEFKAYTQNLLDIEKKLKDLKARDCGLDHQIDFYFNCSTGRLKLRKGNIENSLVFYERKDSAGLRPSYILLQKLDTNNSCEKILESSNGTKVVVDKKRHIYFIDNVKFHLDWVEGLGTFFEIEAIDDKGSLGLDFLETQCRYYLKLFNIVSSDFVDMSYSDLMIEKNFYQKADIFLKNLQEKVKPLGLDLFCYEIDHLCYRVENIFDYYYKKEIFHKMGRLLIESIVGGRPISTFKLNRPIEYHNQQIFLIELPAPKNGSFYPEGLEHAEVVISESFKNFMDRYSHLDFDTSAINKKNNPEIRLKLEEGMNVKFHHQTLESVIISELT